MKKYYINARNNFQSNLVYRFSTYTNFVSMVVIFLFSFYLWRAVYSTGQQIGSYTFKEMISYYLVLNFIFLTTKNIGVSWTVGDEIRYGEINNNLLKPFSYFGYTLSWAVGRLAFCLAAYTVVYAFLFVIFRNYISITTDLKTVLIFIVLALLGFLINFLIAYIVGLTAFWLGVVMGLSFATMSITSFLEGGYVPLDILPGYISKIGNFLPFQYVVYTPISFFTNRISFSWELVFVPVGWIIILYVLATYIFNKGVKRYEGFGA
jgi:ABC-2 type transport system permease protein